MSTKGKQEWLRLTKEVISLSNFQTIKEIRTLMGLTQTELAKLMGVSLSLLSQVEIDAVDISDGFLKKLIKVLPPEAREISGILEVKMNLQKQNGGSIDIRESFGTITKMVLENRLQEGDRLYAIIATKEGHGTDSKFKYKVASIPSLFDEGRFRSSWPNCEPEYILVEAFNSLKDAERRIRHYRHAYSGWDLVPISEC